MRARRCTFMGKKVSKAVFEERMGGKMKVYLDIRLLGLYYCDSDLNVTTKRFHRSSHGRQQVCIRPLEESHYRGNDTAQHRLRGELKTISRSLLTGRMRKSICGWFLKTEDGVTVTFINTQHPPTHKTAGKSDFYDTSTTNSSLQFHLQ